jgi:hypothetical protein
MSTPFRQGRMPCRKARPRLTNLPGMATAWTPEVEQRRSSCRMPGKRQAGCRFLLGTSLLLPASCPPPFGPASLFIRAPARMWTSKREVPQGREAARNALDSSNTTRPERRALRAGCAPAGGVNAVPTLRRACHGRRWKPQGQNALFAWQMLADGCRSTPLASLASATGEGGQVLWRRLAGGCRLAKFPSIPSERMAQRR